MRVGRGAYRGYHEKAVDAGLHNGWDVSHLYSPPTTMGTGLA